MNLLQPHDWSLPVPIAYGPGRLEEIAGHCRRAGMTRPLIVTDRGSSELSFIAETVTHLRQNGLSAEVHADISPNPRDDEIATGRDAFRRGRHDGILAIGGGSGMDGAKAICLVANNDLDLWSFDYDKSALDMTGRPAFPPLICVPTTAGTGAETESTAMVTDTARRLKLCVWHPDLKPRLALLDPRITLGLPRNLTAWTGCDAMVHAIEAYCVPDFHPICDGIALQALGLIRAWLPVAVNEPDNLEARGGMQVGACLAGIAFLKGLGLVHAISHMIGADYDTHHGLTNAVLLPAVLRFNAGHIEDRVPAMASAMDLGECAFDTFYSAICTLLDDLEIPVTLSDIGVPAESAAQLAEKAHRDAACATNPRPANVAEIQSVIEYALFEGR